MTPQPLNKLFDAMYHGKYRFDEFLALSPEENYSSVSWKTRTIYKPSRILKDFHVFLGRVVLDHLPVDASVSFAYRRGAALIQAVEPHAKSRAFFQTDLERFFDSITTPLIRKVLMQSQTPVTDLQNHLEQILKLLTVDGKLPIGFSTSPILSNACLLSFDQRLTKISHDRGWIYTRYADDIMLSTQDRSELSDAGNVIEDCLSAEIGDEFKLNPAKSKLTTIGRKVKHLGLVILPSGDVAIDRDVRNRIESWIHFYLRDRAKLLKIFEETPNQGMEEGLERLSGLVSYAHAADPTYLDKLRSKFGTTVIDSLLHRSAK
ncbi:reverse transcriptase domain-containing protein [Xanthomonas campestris pv. campestris]|uniref:reverse transcriptase domain-containing protein n=1 Tax=Xanthomonas campestris TaxID=339 RepID=UPI0016531F80|nr:reverse transcriptase domain-containing protein [Xanthomonas campestris]MCE4366935.1 reverse transcriptase family protein [Xanthomonas hortorum pv. vitians]MEA0763411.1 reverse transcriptase domain-containing protein [Xanthomonas campestris pv. campestris]MEB1225147.1 reverse transcriptase domain-containing protein [Xanthomonas campestris pv. campestris]MEB1245837.1 reverse transcriptase domain-containing protein [Xanthomonas campestris pv. campestris]MEB1254117.1 reverse transcriptase doma